MIASDRLKSLLDESQSKQLFELVDTQRSLLKLITSRQIRFLGHVLRKKELEAIVLTGKIEGKRARGRQRKMFFGLGVICMWKPIFRSRDSEAVPETRGAPVDRQRQILIRHYNRTGHNPVAEELLKLKSYFKGCSQRSSLVAFLQHLKITQLLIGSIL